MLPSLPEAYFSLRARQLCSRFPRWKSLIKNLSSLAPTKAMLITKQKKNASKRKTLELWLLKSLERISAFVCSLSLSFEGPFESNYHLGKLKDFQGNFKINGAQLMESIKRRRSFGKCQGYGGGRCSGAEWKNLFFVKVHAKVKIRPGRAKKVFPRRCVYAMKNFQPQSGSFESWDPQEMKTRGGKRGKFPPSHRFL